MASSAKLEELIPLMNGKCTLFRRTWYFSGTPGHLWIFDANHTMNWKQEVDMGQRRPKECCYAGHDMVTVGDQIYLFGDPGGGYEVQEIFGTELWVLDTFAMNWTKIPRGPGPWPGDRNGHSMVSIGSQIFLFGGYRALTPSGNLSKVNLTRGSEKIQVYFDILG